MKKNYAKTIISIITLVALVVSIIIIEGDNILKKEQPSESSVNAGTNTTTQTNVATETEVDDNTEKLPKDITGSDGKTKIALNPSQIIDNSAPIILKKGITETEFIVSDATISRELKHSPAIEEDIERVRNRMTRDYSETVNIVFEEDVETFKEGIAFYVYFTVTIKNINGSQAHLSPANITMASISNEDGSYVARESVSYKSRPEYKKYGFFNYAAYHHCIGGIDYYIDGNKFVQGYNYKPGESLTAEVILAVPEEDIKNDCLYIYYSFGKIFSRAAMDLEYKFIKVNITNRGDYFE